METYPDLAMLRYMTISHDSAITHQLMVLTYCGISGTYIDAPYHEDPDGDKICDYPLEKLAHLPLIVVNKPDSRVFEREDFDGLEVSGKAALLNSKHDQFFGKEEYGINTPYLSVEAADYLVEQGVVLVGIDSPLVDNIETSEAAIPVHNILLKQRHCYL
ncbi:cyclase family protein [Vibrio sp. M60_M31a]